MKFQFGILTTHISFIVLAFWCTGTLSQSASIDHTHVKNIYADMHKLLKTSNHNHDCKFDSYKPEKDSIDERERLFWGTLQTIEWLAEINDEALHLTVAEQRMNRMKLRFFLARVGYLQNPGSIVFIDKQTLTMRLTGCRADSIWRHHGSSDDEKLQTAHYVGSTYRNHAPNPHSYIQKYTCFNTGDKRCSHTFYVIIKLAPDMPFGLQVREEKPVKDKMWYCAVPYCSMQECEGANKKKALLRSFPPYKISWQLPKTVHSDGGLVTKSSKGMELLETLKDKIKVSWSWEVKKSKDSLTYAEVTDAAINNTYWVHALGPIRNPDESDKGVTPSFFSEITIGKAMAATHSGLYECVIEDSNGIVSTPNVALKERKFDYVGDANLHVMPKWQLFIPLCVALGCIFLTALIILICPKKMEYDDGTPYTKDELVVPVGAPEPAPAPNAKTD